MDHITAEQFIRRSNKFRENVIGMWDLSLGDLYCEYNNEGFPEKNIKCINSYKKLKSLYEEEENGKIMPLFSEQQVREILSNFGTLKVENNKVIFKKNISETMEIDLIKLKRIEAYWCILINVLKDGEVI